MSNFLSVSFKIQDCTSIPAVPVIKDDYLMGLNFKVLKDDCSTNSKLFKKHNKKNTEQRIRAHKSIDLENNICIM